MVELPVALASLLLGDEHALVMQAAVQYPGGCSVSELAAVTGLELPRATFILWDLANCGLGKYSPPIFAETDTRTLEEAIEGIPSAEERRRFDCALQRPAAGVPA